MSLYLLAIQVFFYGQPIAGILANTREEARAAVKLVKVEYEDLPAVFTIDVNRLSWHTYISMKDLSCNTISNLSACFKNI